MDSFLSQNGCNRWLFQRGNWVMISCINPKTSDRKCWRLKLVLIWTCYYVTHKHSHTHTRLESSPTPSLSAWKEWSLRVRKAPPARTKLRGHELSEWTYWLVISSSRHAFKIFRPWGQQGNLHASTTGVALPSMTHWMAWVTLWISIYCNTAEWFQMLKAHFNVELICRALSWGQWEKTLTPLAPALRRRSDAENTKARVNGASCFPN